MGNPGQRFVGTRHNVGFGVVEALAASRHLPLKKAFLRPYEWSGPDTDKLVLARPLTYMNRSGAVFHSLMQRTKSDVGDLVVVCDNMDLPVGSVRLKRNGSTRAHNGIASVMDSLGTGQFVRLYLGIGRPASGDSVIEHVLARPPEEEAGDYAGAISAAAQAILALLEKPLDVVMNELNARS